MLLCSRTRDKLQAADEVQVGRLLWRSNEEDITFSTNTSSVLELLSSFYILMTFRHLF